jgi:hypothetical protein
MAHFEIAGPVRGILGADLGVETAELVPAATIDTKESEGVS